MTVVLAGDSAELRKARGAFFTPAVVTEFLAEWAIRSASDRLLEPSCGDGAILLAALERLRQLGDPRPIRGFELHEESASAARRLLADLHHDGTIEVGDFLATTAKPMYDAVVGNPPYIRYQGFTGDARARGLAAALAQGVRLSKLASSWAPFVIHAAGYLAPEGRLALVLPAELLASNYAQEVRDFLLRRFASVSVVLFGRHVFPGVQTEALLLLAEGTGGCDSVRFSTVDDVGHLHTVAFGTAIDLRAGERWTTALVSLEAQQHLHQLAAAGALAPLSRWGRLSLGAVTGNNRYFMLSPEQARDLGLASTDVMPVSPAGSSHLRALTLTKRMHGSLGRDGGRTLLFRPAEPSAAALAYIAEGEAMGVQEAFKCRVRTPWWRTPLPAPPDLFFTYMNEATPQLAANPARLHYVNSV
ncbi:MAG: N-6 DNA methylase, partial [Propionicimonas sp.]